MTIYRLRIVQDELGGHGNPRDDDNLTFMACWHRRYCLGDAINPYTGSEYAQRSQTDVFLDCIDEYDNGFRDSISTWYAEQTVDSDEEYHRRILEKLSEYFVVQPLYLYDHSGITISTGKFSCRWDSGLVGMIMVDKAKFMREVLEGPWSQEHQSRALAMIESDVKMYDRYLRGEVYGYEVEELKYEFEHPAEPIDPSDESRPWETVNSCYGFLGCDDTSGMPEQVGKEFATALVEATSDIGKWHLVTV